MDALDKLFQDKFKDFTQSPLPGAFEKINAQLPQAAIGTSASSGSWKGLLSSKAALVKIAVAVTAITAITYAVVKLVPKENPKNTPELPQQNNIPVLPLDSIPRAETKVIEIQGKKEKKKDKAINTITKPVIDTLSAIVPDHKDTVSTPPEEPKNKKAKRKKKYEDFYKKGADDADSTIKLFK